MVATADKRDYYEVLGVDRTATQDQIKQAYRELAMTSHPDRNPAPDATDRFREIAEAYAVLCDPAKREQYDVAGPAGVSERWSTEDILRGLVSATFSAVASPMSAASSAIFLVGGHIEVPSSRTARIYIMNSALAWRKRQRAESGSFRLRARIVAKLARAAAQSPAHSRSPAPSVKAAAKNNKQGPRRQCASSQSRRARAVSAAEHSSNRRALAVMAAASNLFRTRSGCKFRPASTTG